MSSHVKIELKDELVILCSCECIAEGIYIGRELSMWDDTKYIVLHRYLCEQCKGNIIDEGGKATLKKKLYYEKPTWELYTEISNKAFDVGLDFLDYFDKHYLNKRGVVENDFN